MKIAPNGSWLCETAEPHGFDEPLAAAIYRQMREWNCTDIKDFGCGSGKYVKYFNDRGLWSVGYDGNPNTPHFDPHCYVLDLSTNVNIEPCEVVLSLEVGEHVPQQFEQVFLDNLALHAEKYLILSWFPRPGEGIGHVNERSNEYIISQMNDRTFYFLPEVTENLRRESTLWWFKESLMAYARK